MPALQVCLARVDDPYALPEKRAMAAVNSQLSFLFSWQVCVARGDDPYALPVCTTYHSVLDGETCSSIMAAENPPLAPLHFFAMNPGLMCDNLMPTRAGDGMGGQAVSCPACSLFERKQDVEGKSLCQQCTWKLRYQAMSCVAEHAVFFIFRRRGE